MEEKLFPEDLDEKEKQVDPLTPLAERLRPRTLAELVGQEHILGPGKLLRRAIEHDELQSLILWGPPGSGKTTIARIITSMTNSFFVSYSAVISGIKEIKEVMKQAEYQKRHYHRRTILFIDEIHRFNKAQQDAFLPYVERGDIILIGSTTENPSFEINSPLLSRSKVFHLRELTEEDLITILNRALKDEERGLKNFQPHIEPELLRQIAVYANGDARAALNTLEIAVMNTPPGKEGNRLITATVIEDAMQKRILLYDKKGEEHYNIISALHKSMRNSDPDASLYWLARMLEAGEEPLYIARRVVRFASEDIGNADPQALTLAISAMQAVHFIGMPEGNLALAQAVVYMATAPKSNSIYKAYARAKRDVEKTWAEPVPIHLRNAPTTLMKRMGYGKGYKYAHRFEEGIAPIMECLPEKLKGKRYYHPTDRGFEKELKSRLAYIAKLKNQLKKEKR